MTRGGRGWLGLAIACYLLLAAGWLFWTPPLEAADETTHLQYALYMAQTPDLPVAGGWSARAGRPLWEEEMQAVQPPLYFLVAGQVARALGAADMVVAPLMNGARGRPRLDAAASALIYVHGFDERPPYGPGARALLGLRAASVVLGLLLLLLVFLLGRRVFPEDPAVAGLAALLVATLPRFLVEFSSVHNETLLALLAAAALAELFAGAPGRAPTPARAALLGLLAGLALLTKLTALALLPVIVLACLLPALRERRRPATRELLAAALAVGVAAAVCGWWFVRNVRLYGDAFALGPQLQSIASAVHAPGAATDWLLGAFLQRFLGSFVGWFGWAAVPPHPAALAAGAALLALALAGWELRVRRPVEPRAAARPDAVLLLGACMLLAFLQLISFNLSVTGSDGRYVFVALGPAALLAAAGLLAVWRAVAPRLGDGAGAVGLLLALSLPLGSGALLVLQARPALDGRQAPADRFHANLITGAATPLEHPTIELLEPAAGAQLDEPPLLRWSGEARRNPGVPYTLDVVLPDGRPLFSSTEQWGVEIMDEAVRIPAALWQILPVGAPVQWRVRLMPNRAQGQTERDAPGSEFRAFVRVR